jgi:hypothetical protein
MTFLHISLLLGSIAVAAPILLHLLGRRQPKPIAFPAIRFVRQTAVTAQRGWSIKRWLLLALRIFLVLILAIALASPRVPSGQYANYLAGGLFGVFAALATAIAFTAWGGRKAPWMIGVPAVLALALWAFSGVFVVSAIRNSDSIPIGNSDGPVCAAIIVDTSPTMAYKYHNATRLEKAKEMASWLIDRLPVPSQIAILGNDTGARLNPDRLSTERQLERVSVDGKATDLVDRIRTAIDLVRKSELERREIYVLTDLRDGAWRNSVNSELPALLESKDSDGNPRSKILLQLIDVSAPDEELKNWTLTNAKLSQESSVPGGRVTISAEVRGTRGIQDDQLMCELVVEPIDRRLPMVRDGKVIVPEGKVLNRQLVQVPDGGSVPVQMTIQDLAEGTNHAILRLSRPDPLELDNILYITIEARTQGAAAVFSDDQRDGQLVSLLLDPSLSSPPDATEQTNSGSNQASGEANRNKKEDSESRVVAPGPSVDPYARLGAFDLGRVSTTVLYNPRSISTDDAERLLEWVRGGGGLLVVLGPSLQDPQNKADNGLSLLIPGEVKRQTRRAMDDRSIFLNPILDNHPIWSIFERPIREIPWVNYPVFRHWDLENLPPTASEIAKLTGSEKPGMVERIEGQGRILVMTFPYPEPEATAQSEPWSEMFTTSADAWPGFAMFVGTARYLATHNKHPVNYTIDSVALLDNNASQYPKVYELFNPQGEVVRVEAAEELVSFPFTRQPGQYRLRGLRPRGPVVRGFSVNIDRSEISLERVTESTLTEALGPSNYGVAKDKDDVQTSIGEGRYGRDLAPFLLVVIAMMLMAEQTMASRFYASTVRSRA